MDFFQYFKWIHSEIYIAGASTVHLSEAYPASSLNHSWNCNRVALSLWSPFKCESWEAVDKKENSLWWKRKALDGRIWQMEVHLQSCSSDKNSGVTCPSEVYPSLPMRQSLFLVRWLCHSKVNNWVSSFTDLGDIWRNMSLCSSVLVALSSISQGHLE